jgi:hypothetical protein
MGLFDLFSNDTAEKARDEANAGLQAGYTQLSGLYGQGRDAITSGYDAAKGVYTDLTGKYGAGADAYADASGANGPEGLARAQANFTSSPAAGVYGFGLDQGLQALQRQHAAAGNPLSGNADTDAMKFATNLAQNSWGQYTAGLSPYLNLYGTAAGGLAGTDTGEANALNASFTGQGGAANQTQTQIGANDAAAELNNYKIGANQLNALMGIGQLALGMPPTSFSNIGGGSGGSSGSGSYGGVPFGQTAGQPFSWGSTPIGQAWGGLSSGAQNLFSSFGTGNSSFGGGSISGYGGAS